VAVLQISSERRSLWEGVAQAVQRTPSCFSMLSVRIVGVVSKFVSRTRFVLRVALESSSQSKDFPVSQGAKLHRELALKCIKA
jgi:hypothetical protein